jgi:hypothetical protein
MKNFTLRLIILVTLILTLSSTANAQKIGDIYQGGYLIKLNANGTGLVACTKDLWLMNWDDAMDSADSYSSKGFSDWYLPSSRELSIMNSTIGFDKPHYNNKGGFKNNSYYWSSSETGGYLIKTKATTCYMAGGGLSGTDKGEKCRVRLIRSF